MFADVVSQPQRRRRQQRRTRDADRAQRGQVVFIARNHSRLRAPEHIPRTGAKDGRPYACGDVPRRVRPRNIWASGVANDRRSTNSPATWKFHIIQLGLVYQKNVSSAPISDCRATAFKCSSTTPPCPCRIPFGSPVVPEENRIHSGWSNSTGTVSSSLVSASAVSSDARTVARSVGRPACSAATSSRLSWVLPPYR